MCGQMGYTFVEGRDGLRRLIRNDSRVDASEGPTYRDYLLKPFGKVESIFVGNDVTPARWGYKPEWSKELIFCTRIESAFEKPFWRKMIQTSRCIIPVSYFIEFHYDQYGKSPWKIHWKKAPIFFLGGIYSKESDNHWFSVVTQKANETMKGVHNGGDNPGRQPVIIRPENVESWLNGSLISENEVVKTASFYESEEITVGPEKEPEPTLF